jgi:hypothetical protein
VQAKPQVLPEQDAVALPTLVVHFFAHPPQLLTSLVSSTHEPLQFERVPEQAAMHADPEQTGVPASALHA